MSAQTERAFDAEPERELINALREAGASSAFITLIQTDAEEAGVGRNSCRAEVNKWIGWNDGEIEQDALKPNYGGHFFTAMWEGRVGDAWGRADGNNRPLMIEAFGINHLNRKTPNHIEVTG